MPESDKSDGYEKGWAEGFERGKQQVYAAFKWWYEKNLFVNRNSMGESMSGRVIDHLLRSNIDLEEIIMEYLMKEQGVFPSQISAMESRAMEDIAASYDEKLYQEIEDGMKHALYDEDIIPETPKLDDLIEDYSWETRKKTSKKNS